MEIAQQMIQRYLVTGEKLLWAGRPVRRPLISWGGLVQMLLTFFVVTMIFVVLPFQYFRPKLTDPRLGPILILMLVVFGLLALYIVFGKVLTLYTQRRLTFYGVSDRRLITMTREFWGGKVKSIDIDLLRTSSKFLHADATGTLKFGTTPSAFMLHADAGSATSESLFGQYVITFFDIPSAAKVFELVEMIRKEKQVAGESAEQS